MWRQMGWGVEEGGSRVTRNMSARMIPQRGEGERHARSPDLGLQDSDHGVFVQEEEEEEEEDGPPCDQKRQTKRMGSVGGEEQEHIGG